MDDKWCCIRLVWKDELKWVTSIRADCGPSRHYTIRHWVCHKCTSWIGRDQWRQVERLKGWREGEIKGSRDGAVDVLRGEQMLAGMQEWGKREILVRRRGWRGQWLEGWRDLGEGMRGVLVRIRRVRDEGVSRWRGKGMRGRWARVDLFVLFSSHTVCVKVAYLTWMCLHCRQLSSIFLT